MVINAHSTAEPGSTLDQIFEKLFHEFRELFTHNSAPYSVKLSFSVRIPMKVEDNLLEFIPDLFHRYGFEVTDIKLTDSDTIIQFE